MVRLINKPDKTILILFTYMSRQSPIFSKTSNNLYSTLTPLSNRIQADHSRSSKYRYSSLNRNQNSQQAHVSSALSKQYRSTLKTPLPELKQDKVHLLEQWLNDALEGDLPEDGHRRQPLKILKSYELDKGSLRNQNISPQQITKLYNGLFVYSSGIKNAFDQMFTMAAGQTSNRLEKTYWQVFIKLLESTIPVKTCFQIAEQTYIREIAELRKTVAFNKHAVELERENHQTAIRKLKKQIEEGNHRFKQFQSDYNITKATLQMTQLTFNDEVSLRLKFQQKINQVYSSYEQLQQKYQKIKSELNAKKDILTNMTEQKKQLNNKLNEEIIKNNDLMQRYERLQNNLHDLQQQIVIKNQQIMDIQQDNCSVEQQKAKEEFALEEMMLTIKLLKKNQLENTRRLEQAQNVIHLHENNITKLKESLTVVREKNDELYLKYHQTTLKILPVQQQNLRQSIEIAELKNKLGVTEHKNQQSETDKQEMENKYSLICTELQNAEKDLTYKRELLNKYEDNLTEMKEVKDRYERINSKLTFDLNNQRNNYDQKIERLSETKMKIYELKTEIEKLYDKIKTLEVKLANTQQTRDQGIAEMDKLQQIQQRELAERQSIIHQYKIQLEKALTKITILQQTNNKKDNQKLKKLQQITYLRKINTFLEQDVKEKKQIIGKMKQEMELQSNTILQLKMEIEERQFALEKKNEDVDSEKNNLREVIAQQKINIQEKVGYFHPMIVEDITAQLSRLHNNLNSIVEKTKHVNNTYDDMGEELNRCKKQLQQQKEELLNTITAKEESMKEVTKIKEQVKTLTWQYQQKMQEKQQQITKIKTEQKDITDNLTRKINEYQTKSNNSNHIIVNLKTEIDLFKQKEKLRQQIQKTEIATQTEESILNSNSVVQIPLLSQDKSIKKPSSQSFTKQQEKSLSLQPSLQQSQLQPAQHHKERPQKKIEGKQFKKALRLTFMRR